MTDKPVVLVTRRLPDAVHARLQRDYRPRLNLQDQTYSADDLMALSLGAQAIIPCPTDRMDSEVICRLAPSVRVIASYSVGFDHIHLDAARQRGILVTNTPDVLSDATAEIAMLLMLGAARRAHEGQAMVRNRNWPRWSPTWQLGVQLTGKKLGIIGMGRVGQALARRARGFDMRIHYHNRRRLDSGVEQGAVYHQTLEALLPHCEFLSIHCPATPQTTHLLDRERINRLPDGAVVVNTARGAVVDDDALIEALERGKLFAAGLDVFNNEPDIHPRYRTLSNTFLLPHIGSATVETRDAMGFRVLANLDAFFSGRSLRTG